jgi:hypothetical protein
MSFVEVKTEFKNSYDEGEVVIGVESFGNSTAAPVEA